LLRLSRLAELPLLQRIVGMGVHLRGDPVANEASFEKQPQTRGETGQGIPVPSRPSECQLASSILTGLHRSSAEKLERGRPVGLMRTSSRFSSDDRRSNRPGIRIAQAALNKVIRAKTNFKTRRVFP
jgi:hypothetical protein